MQECAVVGKRVPLLDAAEKATGRALFTVDMELPGMLHACILRSPHAHARVLHVDTSRAERLAGVKAVLSKNNAPRSRVPATLGGPKERIAFDEKVRYVGDEVAAVAAVSRGVAREALELIRVDYQVLPAVFDPEEAQKPGAPLIHEGKERNIAASIETKAGETGAGFREADYVFEETFRTSSQRHASMETHASIASFDAAGKLTVWSSTQLPFHIQRLLAEYLAIPMSKVRIVKPYLGGGFGGKLHMVVEHISALLARASGRPVRLVLDREEEFSATISRHSLIIRLKVGVRRDGTLTAIDARATANAGAYLTVTGPLRLVGEGLIRSYRCPNLNFRGESVHTNVTPAGGFRGYGNTQAHFAVESMMDEIARKLAIDPIAFRLKNYKRAGDIGHANTPITSSGLEDCLRLGAEKINWKKTDDPDAGTKRRGKGVACLAHRNGTRLGLPDYSAAFVKLNADGTAHLLIGAADLGTGCCTTLAQIAAEELGLNLSEINVTAADTDATPVDRGAFASATTYVTGGAVRAAAAKTKQQLLSYAGNRLHVSPENLEVRNGHIYEKGSLEKSLRIQEVTMEASQAREGARAFLGEASFENPAAAHSFGAHFSEVEVDVETGHVEVVKMVAVLDIGRAINPMVVEGQIEGAVQQGIGYALTENVIIDEKTGKMLNADFANYMVLTALDMPRVEVGLAEPIDPTGPYGAKGVGEPSTLGVAPAVANAIYDAIGIRFTELPITSEKVFRALREAKSRDSTE